MAGGPCAIMSLSTAAPTGRRPKPTRFRWIVGVVVCILLAGRGPVTALTSLGFVAAQGLGRPVARDTRFTPHDFRGGRKGACRAPKKGGLSKCAASSSTADTAVDTRGRAGVEIILFLVYFGLQSSMSFYMKWVLAKISVQATVCGVPASFFVTASQQLVGFMLFVIFIVGSRLCRKPYTPKRLNYFSKEGGLVLALAAAFSLNIGFNNLSLSLVPLSLSMIIRGCSPLSTALTSMAMSKKSDISGPEWACMVVGVLCAGLVVVAQSGGLTGQASVAFFFGVAVSCCSLLSASLDFVIKGRLGTDVKLNALDTVCYMAIPVMIFTFLLGLPGLSPLPPSWAAYYKVASMSDWDIFSSVWQLNPSVFSWVLLSGVLAFVYNLFVTFMVVRLSPTTTAFAGNFNKAATTLISLIILEKAITGSLQSTFILGGVSCNIAAFTLYNILKNKRLAKEREEEQAEQSKA